MKVLASVAAFPTDQDFAYAFAYANEKDDSNNLPMECRMYTKNGMIRRFVTAAVFLVVIVWCCFHAKFRVERWAGVFPQSGDRYFHDMEDVVFVFAASFAAVSTLYIFCFFSLFWLVEHIFDDTSHGSNKEIRTGRRPSADIDRGYDSCS